MSEIDPRLSRLYREASTEEPAAAVDAAILAAARQRLAAPRPRARPRWSRWLVPASLTATLVLGVSVSLLIEREHPEMLTGETAVPAPPRPAPLGDAATAKPKAEMPAAATRAEKPVPTLAGTMPAALPPPVVDLRAKPSAADVFPAERGVNSAEPRAARESEAAAGAAASQGSIAPAPPAAAAKSAPMRMETSQRSPESWLDDIRRLKREGRDKEVAEQLAEFRKQYPGFTVPADLSR